MARTLILLTFLTLSILYTVASADGPWDLYSGDDFKSLRDCAKGCYGNGGCDPFGCNNPVPNMLSCAGHMVNSCVCRPDLQSIAESAMYSCVKTACGNTLDISSATSVYLNYCQSAGYTKAPPAPTTTSLTIQSTTTSQPISTLQQITPTSTSTVTRLIVSTAVVTVVSDATSLSATPSSQLPLPLDTTLSATTTSPPEPQLTLEISSGKHNSALNQGDKIALGVGLSVPLLAIVVSILVWRYPRQSLGFWHSIGSGEV